MHALHHQTVGSLIYSLAHLVNLLLDIELLRSFSLPGAVAAHLGYLVVFVGDSFLDSVLDRHLEVGVVAVWGVLEGGILVSEGLNCGGAARSFLLFEGLQHKLLR